MAKLFPPPSITLNNMTNTEWRNIGIHRYQVSEIAGSEDQTYGPISSEEDMHNYQGGFFASGCTGAGPIYDIYLKDNRVSIPSGMDLVRVGDHIIIQDDTGNDIDTDDYSYYRYDVREIKSNFGGSAASGWFEVRYVADSAGFGEQSPCDLYINYKADGYGGTVGSGYLAAIFRPLNTEFLIGE